jgi:hypothetical protein
MAKVGVGTAVSGVEAAYAVPVDGDGEALVENSTQQVTVEVRDRFNNPVAGVDVNATLVGPAGGSIGPAPGDRNRTNLTTDAAGRVTLTYRAPADLTGTDTAAATVRFGFGNGTAALRGSGYDPRGPTNVSVNLTVENADGSGVSGPGSGINPNGDGAVVLRGAGISSSGCALGTTCRVNVFLENTASSGTRTIERARFNFYDVDNQPGTGNANQRSPPSTVEFFNTTSGTATLRSASSGGAFEAVEATVPASQSAVGVRLQFSAANGDPFEVLQGDFFVMSVVFEDGATATYFVAPVDNPTVNPGPGNAAPTADAGGPYAVSEGATVGLDATGSSDPDGDSLSYSWAITGDDYGASIQNPDTATPTFDASGASVSQNRDVTVEVTVTDGNGGSATDTATVTIQDGGSSGVAANVEVAQVQVDNGDVVVQFRNDNPTSVTFERARLDSYTEANTPNDVEPIDRVVYRPGVGGPELVGGDGLEPVGGPTLSNGANQDVTLQPRRDTNTLPGMGNRNIEDADAQPGDTLSITVEFGDGSTRTYDITL